MLGQRAATPMTVATFLEWANRRPEGERWDLIEGEPVPTRGPAPKHAMAAETLRHAAKAAWCAQPSRCRSGTTTNQSM
jgi:hypothetical protein